MDGEVVKKYELPDTRPEEDRVSHGLKKMGMEGFMKGKDKMAAKAVASGQGAVESDAGASSQVTDKPGESLRPSTLPRSRRKSTVAEEEAEDDKRIRFTIGGVGQRLTKDNFIREMQQLDARTRREVVDKSDAPKTVKDLAKQEPASQAAPAGEGNGSRNNDKRASRALTPTDRISPGGSSLVGGGSSGQDTAGSGAVAGRADDEKPPSLTKGDSGGRSSDLAETAVERRRRMAALQGVGRSNGASSSAVPGGARERPGGDNQKETPAERRRREAALGISEPTAGGDDDSEDDDTVRVPPAARRGIRVADVPPKGR